MRIVPRIPRLCRRFISPAVLTWMALAPAQA